MEKVIIYMRRLVLTNSGRFNRSDDMTLREAEVGVEYIVKNIHGSLTVEYSKKYSQVA